MALGWRFVIIHFWFTPATGLKTEVKHGEPTVTLEEHQLESLLKTYEGLIELGFTYNDVKFQ
jgi:hypothetical protein